MKEFFEQPELMFVEFTSEDVICTSGEACCNPVGENDVGEIPG